MAKIDEIIDVSYPDKMAAPQSAVEADRPKFRDLEPPRVKQSNGTNVENIIAGINERHRILEENLSRVIYPQTSVKSANGGEQINDIKLEVLTKIREAQFLRNYSDRLFEQEIAPLKSGENPDQILAAEQKNTARLNTISSMGQSALIKPLGSKWETINLLFTKEYEKRKSDFSTYELSPTYIQQVLRKFPRTFIDEQGGAFTTFNELMEPTILLPIGIDGLRKLDTLANELLSRLKRPIFLKKITGEHKTKLLTEFNGYEEYKYPYDEDYYPQVISDLKRVDELDTPGWAKIRYKTKHLLQRLTEYGINKIDFADLTKKNVKNFYPEILQLINEWACNKLERMQKHGNQDTDWLIWDLIEPYTIFLEQKFIDNLEKYNAQGKIMYAEKKDGQTEVIGLSVAAKTGSDIASLYANLNHPLYSGAAHLLIAETARDLYKGGTGVRYLNMGGSEKGEENLYKYFKRYFNPLPQTEEPKLHCLRFKS